MSTLAIPATMAITAQMTPATASSYPNRAIHLIVGYGTAGGTDIVARVIAPALAKHLDAAVIVDNKPGANGIIGATFVAHAAPDGYTLLVGPAGEMVVNPAVYPHLPYDTVKDFTPISEIVSYPLLLSVSAKSPIRSVKDLVLYAKAHPDKANYGTFATLFWLVADDFSQRTGIHLTRVDYKGSASALMAVISGEVLCSFNAPQVCLGPARAGTIRVLAVTAQKRLSDFPDVPTMAEAGVPGMVASDWVGLWAQKATPKAIIDRLQSATRQMIKSPDVVAEFKKLALERVGSQSDQFNRVVRADVAHWRRVARAAHLSIPL